MRYHSRRANGMKIGFSAESRKIMSELVRKYRQVPIYAGSDELFLNLLLLAPTLHMLQVFDRVFSSRSDETLFWLTAITVALSPFTWSSTGCVDACWPESAPLVDRLLGERVMLRVLEDAAAPRAREARLSCSRCRDSEKLLWRTGYRCAA